MVHVSISSRGGAGGAAAYLVERQRFRGIDAVLMSTTGDDLLSTWRRHPLIFLSGLTDFFAVRKPRNQALFSLLRRSPNLRKLPTPDVVHLHWTPGAINQLTIAAFLTARTPVVSTLHDFWPLTGGCHFPQGCSSFISSCEDCPQARRVFHHKINDARISKGTVLSHPNHHLVAPSRWMYDHAVSHPDVDSNRIHHIPNLIDLGAFEATRPARHPGDQEIDVALRVGFVAAQINEPRKGLKLLVDACAALRKDGIEVHLLSAGQGRQHGDRPWWNHFGPIGSKRDLTAFYSQCDIVVVPSFEDNAPTVLIEAGLSGIPVVAPRNSGGPEFIKHGWSGYICESPAELHATLALAHRERSSLPQLGERLRRDLQETLNEDRIMSQLLTLYEQGVANRADSGSS